MWDKDDASFGAWLRRRRRLFDLTQAELGRRVGISAAAVRKIEADERRPSAQVAARLADALAVPPEDRGRMLQFARGIAALAPGADGDAVREAAARPPLTATAATSLPLPLTPLIGRAALVAAVAAMLDQPDVRLVTLVGPGGIGKTRVAVEVAAEVRAGGRAHISDGVVFVPLAEATAADVDTALARALCLRDRGDRPALDQLLDALRDRRTLLVLDNAEHLLAAVPQLVALLRGAPDLRLLVTSRAVLRVSGEHVVAVPPLDLPAPDSADGASPAVQLFLDRARAVAPGRPWTPADIAAVADVCRMLDGIPLAIELAAARSRLLSPRALLDELGASPLDTLAGGPRDLPARQQTLRATLGWSVGLLTAQEQALLAGLGVFGGGWSLALARAALGPELATLDALASLVDHSLAREIQGRSGELRFAFLDVIRRYAVERLAASGNEAAVRERWAPALLDLAEEAARGLRGAEQGGCLDRLDEERANLTALLAWSVHSASDMSGRPELTVRLVTALIPFWWRRGAASEAQRWLDAALAAAAEAPIRERARLLAQAARLAWQQGELALASSRADEALSLSHRAGDPFGVALAHLTLGAVYWYRGDSGEAETHLAESLTHAGGEDARWVATEATLVLALVAYHRGEHELREALLGRSLALARDARDTLGVAEALLWSGNLAVERGSLDEAEPAYREALAHFLALGDQDGEARVLHKLADLAHDRGDLSGARAQFATCLAIRRAIGDRAGVAVAQIGLGDVLLKQGDHDGARACYGEALALMQARGDQVDRAWAIRGLARVAQAGGELRRARQLFRESLRLAWAQANPWGIAVCLEGLGGAEAALGNLWYAGVLFGAADGVRARHQLLVVPGALPDVERDREVTRARLGHERFAAAVREGRERPLEPLIAEVLTDGGLRVADAAEPARG